MINGPLLKNIIIFSLPLMASNALQILFNAADTIVVGKFAGDEALAAVGATGNLIYLLTCIFQGLSTGSNVVVANAIGTNERERIKKASQTSIYLGLVSGLFLTILGFFGSKFLLSMVSTPSNIIDLSTLYMKIYFGGSIFMIVYNFGSAILRSKGDTKRPLNYLIISGVVNLVLNLILVIIFKMSVVGVAIATVVSQALSCLLVLNALAHETDETKFIVSELSLDKNIAIEILKIGIPAGFGGMAFSISNVVIQGSINSFNSSIIIAGNSAAANIEGFVYIGMIAFAQATITFTSQNVGANNYKNVHKIYLYGLLLDFISAFLLGFSVWYFGNYIVSLYTNDPLVVEIGVKRLFYIALPLFLNGLLDITVNSLRGMGYSSRPTLIMMLGVCGFRLLWIWLYFPLHQTLDVIYMCFPISWVITLTIEIILWTKCYKAFKDNSPVIL